MNYQPIYPQDLQWLEEYILFFCQQEFTFIPRGNLVEEPNTIPTWMIDWKEENCYHRALQHFTAVECIVILIALANQIYPKVWESFSRAIDQLGLDEQMASHFGLAQLSGTPYLQATLGTVLFLLGGTTAKEQARYWELFVPSAPLQMAGALKWPISSGSGVLPSLNTIPQLSSSFLHQLIQEQPYEPQYSPDFPATLLTTTKTWDDLILGERIGILVAQTRKWVQYYTQISTQPGVHQSQGYRLLMSGPSGTGKTMTAALLGAEAGKPVYRIDISNIVDKYVGETSKKLRQIFELAEAQDWILFFDEGDALFGKRTTDGQSSNERYANQEVSYLLYKLEEYQGMIFLATNHQDAIDRAFERRFDSLVTFDNPDKYTRQRLWQHFFEHPGLLQVDPVVRYHEWQELAFAAEVSAAWIEKFYDYCVMQTTAKGDTYISADEMR